ncbi:helix-turn-helix transcriptional regulator, partial [Hungatella hathewayi]|uniref:helix-turn-helix domain-containing protein n=1 Tax=Hungatella hathewayi TaxID=154046 RepID=UPI0026E1BC07
QHNIYYVVSERRDEMVTYNRQEVGRRLSCRRREMGLTGEEIGRRIGKNGRYYRDIENGRCGMSIETLILLAEEMGLSLDYLIYGASDEDSGKLEEQKQIVNRLSHCNGRIREGAVNLLKVYLESVSK